MTTFLFLQRFEQGAVAPMPFQPLMQLLARHGTVGRGQADVELTLAPDTIASGCTVIGDGDTGISCVGFERPRYDAALRQLAWECFTHFGCTIFNDTLDLVYTAPGGAAALPAAMRAACTCGMRAIGSAQQLWPDQPAAAGDGRVRPALLYTNPNSNGPNWQMFDDGNLERKELTIAAAIRPAACNQGTLRVLRNLELRVDAAMRANPGYTVAYRYAHHEASLLLLESPRLTERAMQATFITGMPGAPEPEQPGFVADSGVYGVAMTEAAALIQHVQQKYQLALDGTPAGIDKLAGVLDKLHAYYRHERSQHPPGSAFHSALAAAWAVRAGSYLGDVVRLQVGAQWGYIERGPLRVPVVRTHRGRLCFPQQQVLDHVINGQADNIAAWFRALAASDASPTPRDEDHACQITVSAGLLLADGAPLPYAADIPRRALDYSVGSLRHLDHYLAHIARNAGSIPGPRLGQLVIAAWAYLGEVVRINAPDRALWQWVNYDDFLAASPDFAQQRPREIGFAAFLDSPAHTCYPFEQARAIITGQSNTPAFDWACQLLGDAVVVQTAAALPDAINAWPADQGMANEIEHVRAALAGWRRLARPSDYNAMRPATPDWLRKDALGDIVDQRDLLLGEGQVVWGGLVQANGNLFEPGPHDHPAALAYSLDPHFDSRPQALRALGHEMFAHKGTAAPAYIRRVAAILTDEMQRPRDIPLPPEMTDRQVMLSAFMVFRQDIPEATLGGGWFPVLIHADTDALMIAPRRFWSNQLVALWAERVMDI